MSTTLLFYKDVSGLSTEAHRDLKLKPVNSFEFAAQTHVVPLAGAEFYSASRHYPIVFTGEEGGDVSPIAIVGLEAGSNAFVAADGHWRERTYVPAFVRRYPFVPAQKGDQDDEFTVCFDASCSYLNETEGQPLFNEDGSHSPLLIEAVQFLSDFKGEMERTLRFAGQLKKFDLLERSSATIQAPDGATFAVQDFWVVSEEKLGKLKPKELAELHQDGFLGWIFAHLMSLANLPELHDIYRQHTSVQ